MKHLSLVSLLITYLLLAVSPATFGQLKNYNTEVNIWLPGKITLFDGNTLKGKVNYNFITDLLSIDDGNASKSFTAKKASYFEMLDEGDQIKKYYSLPFEVRKGKELQNLFFEVVYENQAAAILSRHEYEYKLRGTAGGKSSVPAKEDLTVEMEKVSEVLYLASGDGQILEFASKKKDRSTTLVYDTENDLKATKYGNSRTRRYEGGVYRITNSDALSIVCGEDYVDLVKDCESKGYRLNTVEGLTYFVDYCLEPTKK